MFRKLYAEWYVRIPLKFMFTMTVVKISLDFAQYMTQNAKFGIPRTMDIYSGQNPISPPIPVPYPYADTYENLQNIKAFHDYQRKLFHSIFRNIHRQNHILVDHPCRENPNSIDHFVQYGNIYRVKEYINYMFVNKLKSEGIQIPQGINQGIRELEQHKLDFLKPIVPQL